MKNKVLVFDLDDTLYKEITFLYSAFLTIEQRFKILYPSISAQNMYLDYLRKEDVFHNLIITYQMPFDKSYFRELYRNHIPNIRMPEICRKSLQNLMCKGYILGIITDGRSITQRNKIRALRVDELVDEDNIIISEEFGSEKPSLRNYEYFQKKYMGYNFVYVGDNPQKDFVAPNQLGWTTVCLLDNGQNIHKQNFLLSTIHLPQYKIFELEEIKNIV